MASNASQPRIPFSPAFAFLKPKGRRASGGNAFAAGKLNIPPRPVACAAEVDGVHGIKPCRIDDCSRRIFARSRDRGGWHGCNVRRARAVARVATDSENEILFNELAADGGGGRMAREAADNFGRGHRAVHSFSNIFR